METTPVLVYHNGQWQENKCYTNFETTGILIPKDCTFTTLREILEEQIQINKQETVQIKYQLQEGLPPLKIETDFNLKFYMQIKNKEEDWMKFPLCIDIISNEENLLLMKSKETNLQQIRNMCETGSSRNTESYHPDGNMGETSIEASAVGNIDETFIDFIDFANIVCKYVTEEATVLQIDEPRHDEEEIQVGDVFEDREALSKYMSSYALKNHFHFRVKKSCKRQYNIRCIVETCNWHLKASANIRTTKFIVRKLDNNHTCTSEQRMNSSKNATTKLVADLIKSKYLNNIKTVYTPADIIRDMKDEHKVTLEYKKAWRSKEKALEMLRGKPDESYQKLPAYLYMLKKTNPGSVGVILKTENDDFLFLFMALNASIKGWKYCKPIIVVDDTILRASYGGKLLSAYTQDANGRIFPLAFAIVDSENDNSWTWFFENLRKTFGLREGLCIVSDRHNTIVAAINKVYPEAAQAACMYHLLNDLKKHFKRNDKQLTESFVGAAKAYTDEQFEKHMSKLDSFNIEIRAYLANIGYDKWARLHCPNKRYFAMSSNITDLLNAANVAGRELPVTTLLEYLRSLIQDWTCKNRDEARSTFTKLTRIAEEYLGKNHTSSLTLRVNKSNDHIFKVSEDVKVFIVDLEKRSCTCNMFQMDEIPCSHAIGVLKEVNQDPYNYCSDFYLNETMVATYSETVYPIGHEATWMLPDEFRNVVVLPPAGMSRSGRPKKKRQRAAWEKHLRMTCGRCGESGHNKKTCKNTPQKTPVS